MSEVRFSMSQRGGAVRRFATQPLARWLAEPPVSQTRAKRVLLAGKLTGLVAPGGGEVQLQSLAQALKEAGLKAELWRPWSDTLDDVALLHLLGSEPEHLQIVAAARQRGIPVALSTIAWFDVQSCWRESRSWPARLSATGKFLVRAAMPRLPSWRRKLYQACDLLLPNSLAEAQQLMRYFGIPAKKIRVVPNGADPRFGTADPRPFARRAGCSHFVLYPGRIEPRKNQLGFLKAMQGVDVPIVILGDSVPGHEAYEAACRAAAGPKVRFMARRDHHDPLLASAYAACGCVALASWFETPGLVALEAGMSGVPLVLPAHGAAREYFGPLASYVAPHDPRDIRTKVLAALARERSADLAMHVRENFSWTAAALATRDAYAVVLEGKVRQPGQHDVVYESPR
jgi:glycosyltransferase involved in cell wall biosynthesis